MFRNAVELTEDIDFLLDRVKSPRHDTLSKVRALNMAQDKVINDRYDNFKKNRRASFQAFQRIRDELRTIVTDQATGVVNGNIITYPTTCLYLLNVVVTIDGIQRQAEMITYDEEILIEQDPFDKPTAKNPKCIESSAGIKILHDGVTLSSAKISFLKIPAIISVLDETTYLTLVTFTNGQVLYVQSGTVTYNAINYSQGETFTIDTTISATFTGTGSVIKIVNCELPGVIHDEISQIAASILAGNTDDANKKNIIEIEKERS